MISREELLTQLRAMPSSLNDACRTMEMAADFIGKISMTRQDLENSFDAAMLALSRLSDNARATGEMALFYAANRAWHELDAARLKQGGGR